MIANAQPIEYEINTPDFFQELSAFIEKHKGSLNLEDEALSEYIEQKFDEPSATPHQDLLINLDAMPSLMRQFIEMNNRLAGRDVGRSGMDAFFSEDHDSALGPETDRQRSKRLKRADAMRRWLDSMMRLMQKYEDTYKTLRNAESATDAAQDNIKHLAKLAQRVAAAEIKLKSDLEKLLNNPKLGASEKKTIKDAIKNLEDRAEISKDYQSRLKQEKEDLDEYRKEVVNPAKKALNSGVPTEDELENIQQNLTRTMPGRPWRIFQSLMDGMKNKFNSFPRMNRHKDDAPAMAPAPSVLKQDILREVRKETSAAESDHIDLNDRAAWDDDDEDEKETAKPNPNLI